MKPGRAPAVPKLSRVAWITPEGCIDFSKIPLEDQYRRALSSDRTEVSSAVRLLESTVTCGRPEAAVFLMGLLVNTADDDLELRSDIVRALRYNHTRSCATLLAGEFRRIKSSNTTRRYLGEVLEALAHFPASLVLGHLEALAADPGFSPKMRVKFREAACEKTRE